MPIIGWFKELFNKQIDPREDYKLFEIGGGWSDSIQWSTDWNDATLNHDDVYRVHGWKNTFPRVGDVLKAEFRRSYCHFVFTNVRGTDSVRDMFTADVMFLNQDMK